VMRQPQVFGRRGATLFQVPGAAMGRWFRGLSARPRDWRWLIIPICAVIGMTAGIAWAFSTRPTYTANAAAFIAFTPHADDDPFNQDPFAGGKFALQRAPTYAALATSADVLQAVVAETHHGDVDQLRRQVKVTATPDMVLLRFSVDDPDPKAAAQVANSVIANLGRTIGSVERAGAQHGTPPVQILPVEPAFPPVRPSSHRRDKVLEGLLAGLTIGCAAFYLIRRRDRRKQRDEDARPESNARTGADTDVLYTREDWHVLSLPTVQERARQ